MKTPRFYSSLCIIQKFLSLPTIPLWAAIVAGIITLPALNSGWLIDDLWHRLAHVQLPQMDPELTKVVKLRGPMNMFSFLDQNSNRFPFYLKRGVLPWWISENIHIAFWRPLSALLSELDYALWPEHPFWMHVQSMLWYVGLILITAMYYRKIMPTAWVAGLAALLFSVNHANAMGATWLANRHAVIAVLFGVLTLWAHDAYIRSSSKKWLVWAGLFLVSSLLGSEAGIAVLAYLIAYNIFINPQPIPSKIITLIPYLLIIIFWRILYNFLGYGASGGELYIDPVREPMRFIGASLERVPILLLGAVGWPPAEIYLFLSRNADRLYACFSLLFLTVGGVLLFPLIKQSQHLQFWGTGMVLSIIPLCAAIPSNRNLSFAALGAMGFIAQAIYIYFESAPSVYLKKIPRISLKLLFLYFLLAHGVISPIMFWNQPKAIAKLHAEAEHMVDIRSSDPPLGLQSTPPTIAEKLSAVSFKQKEVIFVNPPVGMWSGFVDYYLIINQIPFPKCFRVLSPGFQSIQITRPDENTMIVRPQLGFFPPPEPVGEFDTIRPVSWMYVIRRLERLLINPSESYRIGDTKELPGVHITLTQVTPDKRPAEVKYQFDEPLESPSYLWLQWKKDHFEPMNLPSVGQTVILADETM